MWIVFFDSCAITPALSTAVQENTRNQAHPQIWFQQQSGRVTVSKLRAAYCTDIAQPAQSLIKAVCCPESVVFNSYTWGCYNEEHAGKEYERKLSKEHIIFGMSRSGVYHSSFIPLDGLVQVCNDSVLEIKWPYSCQTKLFKIDQWLWFLIETDWSKHFPQLYHGYYFQVQVLKFSNAEYCDFIVWNADSLFIQQILLDEPFITIELKKWKQFIKFGYIYIYIFRIKGWNVISIVLGMKQFKY